MESVVSVERHSERVLILNMVLDNGLLTVFMVYAPHSGKLEEEKKSFCNKLFHFVNCKPQNETVVLVGDKNGHVGSSNVGYDGMVDYITVWQPGRRTKQRFVTLMLFQMKNVYQSINC